MFKKMIDLFKLLENKNLYRNISKKNYTKFIPKIFSMFFLLLLLNCAIFERENLRLVNAVEENLVPENSTMKILAAPIYIPLGVIGGILDVFLIHPISVIPKAANSTIEGLWRSRELGYVTKMGAIPFTTIATPFFFTLSWTYYWFFESKSNYSRNAGVETTEEWKEELKNSNQKKNYSRVSELLSFCYGHINSENTSDVLIEVLRNPSLPEPDYQNGIGCITSSQKFTKDYENFILEMYKKKPDSFFMYIRYFEIHKSKKGSEILLKDLFDQTRKSENIPELIRAIYAIGVKEHRREIEDKLK